MDFYNVSLLNMIFEAEKKLAIRLTELLCTVSTACGIEAWHMHRFAS